MDTVYTPLNFADITKIKFGPRLGKLEILTNMTERGDVVYGKKDHKHIFVNDPHILYQILVKNVSNYSKQGTSFEKTKDILGTGILTDYGATWASGRKCVQPHFYHQNLHQCVPIINAFTDKMLDNWQSYAKSRKAFNIVQEMSTLVLEISSAILFGKSLPRDGAKTIKMIRYANAYVPNTTFIWRYKPTIANLRYQHARVSINNVCLELLSGDHDEFEGMNPLLSPYFITADTDEQRIDRLLGEAKNFLLAGHETTGAALSWAFYCLGNSPHTYQLLYDEGLDILNGQDPRFDNYDELELVEYIMKETMRLYPPIWSIERMALDDDYFGDLHVPKGAHIFMCPFTMHRHPGYWDTPNTFNVFQFTKHNMKNRPKCAYMPFGMGERVCIGQHLGMMIATCVLAKIVQRYHFRLTNNKKIGIEPLITLKPKPDIMIRIQEV